MDKKFELSNEDIDQVTGGDGIIYNPGPNQGEIKYDPNIVVDNVLRCSACGHVIKNECEFAALIAYCPACGAPLFQTP